MSLKTDLTQMKKDAMNRKHISGNLIELPQEKTEIKMWNQLRDWEHKKISYTSNKGPKRREYREQERNNTWQYNGW